MGEFEVKMALPDEEVVRLATQGDRDAFSILYQKYVNKIYSYIYYRTGNANDAEDLTARVFYRALGHISSYQQKGIPFSAWLYRIAHNIVANWHRDNSRRKEVSLDDHLELAQKDDYPEITLLHNQTAENLLKNIRKLPSDRQQLIILKFVERLSNAEVAQIMRRSEGAIKSLYHRTLTTLRFYIEKEEG